MLVKDFPGESPVYVALETSDGPKTLALGPAYRVELDPTSSPRRVRSWEPKRCSSR